MYSSESNYHTELQLLIYIPDLPKEPSVVACDKEQGVCFSSLNLYLLTSNVIKMIYLCEI